MTTRSNKLAVWAGAAAFALLAPLAHANYVTNGGFEDTPDFNGWTLTGDTTFTLIDSFVPHSGEKDGAFGPDPSGGIFQMIATDAGQVYTVDFWVRVDDLVNASSFSWSWNGVDQAPAQLAVDQTYVEYSATVVGAAGSTELAFTFSNPSSFFELDDVSVVPEPGTLALMGVAMLAGGVARRRKKLV